MVYDCFNNPFTGEFGRSDSHLPPITIDDRTHPHKRARYTPDLLPAAISVSSENSVSTLTTPSDSPDLLPFDDPNTLHVMKKVDSFQGRVQRGYFCKKNSKKFTTKRQGSIAPHSLIRTRNIIIVIDLQDYFRDNELLPGTSTLYHNVQLIVLLVSLT